MSALGSVQQKISCLFETSVLDEPSQKRQHQTFRVVATDTLKGKAIDSDIYNAVPTEKLDGTCVYIENFKGKPWLWARLDRKPNKGADRRFKKFQAQHETWNQKGKIGDEPQFEWDPLRDFKDIPDNWIPASGVPLIDGIPQPDKLGHIPGWVPVDPKSKQHCWHLSTVDFNNGLAIVLREDKDITDNLEIVAAPLQDMLGHTAELVGTNVNANPYGLGRKPNPIHVLVIHGSIKLRSSVNTSLSDIKNWMECDECGKVEGVVWHCPDGTLFKLHRHHLGLQWPIQEPSFSLKRIKININALQYVEEGKSQFSRLGKYDGHTFQSFSDLTNVSMGEKNAE